MIKLTGPEEKPRSWFPQREQDLPAPVEDKAKAPTKPKRRIVQIASDDGRVLALCNDGTVWRKYGPYWELLPDVPQHDDIPT